MRPFWISISLAFFGCDVDQVIIATFASDAGSDADTDAAVVDDAGMVGPGCQHSDDCAIDEYCQKERCDANTGRCARRPTICTPDPAPVCGCDGITYYNDCLRQQSGVAAAFLGDCPREIALRCGGAMALTCPASSFCARLVPAGVTCPSELLGTCWVIPECDPSVPRGGERFAACEDDVDQDERCVDACRAIRSERPHVRRFRCMDGRGPDDRAGHSEP
jgi:hypothetical protein